MALDLLLLQDGTSYLLLQNGTDRLGLQTETSGGSAAAILLTLLGEEMQIRSILKGATDQSVVIRIVDSATGLPETGVEHNTSGIDLWYRREGAAKVSITEAALSALTDAHSDGGIEALLRDHCQGFIFVFADECGDHATQDRVLLRIRQAHDVVANLLRGE